MKNLENLIGKSFGKLTVIDMATFNKRTNWLCKCECGKRVVVCNSNLKSGNTKSCGCVRKYDFNLKHGMGKTRQYRIWCNMIHRCHSLNSNRVKSYIGKGVKVCDKWKTFDGFWEDMQEGYADNLSIDRIDNNGNYEKSNCKWSTAAEQNRNSSNNHNITFDGKTMVLQDWANQLGITASGLYYRIKKWGIEKSLTKAISKAYTG